MFRPMKYKAWTEEQMPLAHQAYITVCAGLQKSMESQRVLCKTELVAKFCLVQIVVKDISSVRKKNWLVFWYTVHALVSLAVGQK